MFNEKPAALGTKKFDNIEFNSATTKFGSMTSLDGDLSYDDVDVYLEGNERWVNSAYRTVVFPASQLPLSQALTEWLTANAVKQ